MIFGRDVNEIYEIDNIETIFYGYDPTTLETHLSGIYATSTTGPTIDPDNLSRVVKSNPECAK